MQTLIKTDKSSLNLFDIDETKLTLIKDIVDTIDSRLDHHPEIMIFGKIAHQRRSVGFFSNVSKGYKYSGKMAKAKLLDENLKTLIDYINTKFDSKFNGILVNKYENGTEYIGKHSDDETDLDKKGGVVAISYGAQRKFRIRNKFTNKIEKDILTNPRKIIQMKGYFQKEFTHEIPLEKKVKECRYSFTFRCHL